MNKHFCDFCGVEVEERERSSYNSSCSSKYHVQISSTTYGYPHPYQTWYEVCKSCELLWDRKVPEFIESIKHIANKRTPL